MTLRVAVFGAGAIGSFYGARLSDGGANVSLIARGRHLEAIRERGLTITTPGLTRTYTIPATDDPATLGPVDIVLFTVKSYDTTDAAERIRPLLHETTGVVSLQNGIDNEDRIAGVIGREHVLGGAAYILAAVREPGVVEAGGPLAMVIGELDGGPHSERVQAVLEVAARAGLAVRVADDVRVALWDKYTLLVAFSAMTGTVRLPIGAIRQSSAATEMLHALMTEVWTIGRAEGVALDDELVDRQMGLLLSQDPEGTSSLYQDLVGGRRMELEALQGTAIRLGRRHGIPTPALDAAYAILQPWAMRNERAAEERTAVAT